MNIKFVGAHPNNFQVGRGGKSIKYVVCHWIVGTLESADATFQNPQRIASATYGIGDNDTHQYVKENDTAYANGNFLSNQESISIEHEGGPDIPITNATYETSAQLIAEVCKRYLIPLDRNHIRKHNEVSDKPTQCPGTLDLDRLIKRAKELYQQNDTLIDQPAWTAQTKIPINTVTVLETYTEKELQAVRSDYIAKDQTIKDLQIANNQQAIIVGEYQKQAEQLNEDLYKLTQDFRKYKDTHPDTPVSPNLPPTTPPAPPPGGKSFINYLRQLWPNLFK